MLPCVKKCKESSYIYGIIDIILANQGGESNQHLLQNVPLLPEIKGAGGVDLISTSANCASYSSLMGMFIANGYTPQRLCTHTLTAKHNPFQQPLHDKNI